MSTMYINNIVNDTTIVQSNRSDGRLVRWLNFCFVVEKNQLAACSTHTLRSKPQCQIIKIRNFQQIIYKKSDVLSLNAINQSINITINLYA